MFFQSGDEFLRTKKGVKDSFKSPISINRIDWSLKPKNFDAFKYYQGLIKLRNNTSDFRFNTWDKVNSRVKCETYDFNPHATYTTINPGTGEIKVIYSPDPAAKVVAPWLPVGCNSWKIAVEGEKFPSNKFVNEEAVLDCRGGICVMFPSKKPPKI